MTLDEVPEGSFRACLREFLRQGIRLNQAIAACAAVLPKVGSGDPLDPAGIGSGALGRGSDGRPMSGVEAVNCGLAGGSNPAMAYGAEYDAFHRPKGDVNFGKPDGNYEKVDGWWLRRLSEGERNKIAEQDAEQKANKLSKDREVYNQAVNRWTAAKEELKALKDAGLPDDDPGVKAAKEKVDKADKEVGDTLHDVIEDGMESDKPPPTHAPPAVTKPSRMAMDTCNAAARFVAECNRVLWKSSICMSFLAMINHCSDPTITNPNPMDVEVFGCAVLADSNATKKARVLVCTPTTQPVPGEDPCKLLETEATVIRYGFRTGDTSNPCNDPRGYVLEDGCVSSFTLTSFGARDAGNIIQWGQEHLGGPVVVVPESRPFVPEGPESTTPLTVCKLLEPP